MKTLLFLSPDCKLILVGTRNDGPAEQPPWEFPEYLDSEVESSEGPAVQAFCGFDNIDSSRLIKVYSSNYDGSSNTSAGLCWYKCVEAERAILKKIELLVAQNGFRYRWMSAKQFWSEIQTCPASFGRRLLDIVGDVEIQTSMIQYWSQALVERRDQIANILRRLSSLEIEGSWDEATTVNAILPRPLVAAREFDVNAVFAHGMEVCPGAYRISEMVNISQRVAVWRSKLLDPYERYVAEELQVLAGEFRSDKSESRPNVNETEEATHFVWALLNYPLRDGSILRDELGNLEELAAVKNALKLFLCKRYPHATAENLLGKVNSASNSLVAAALAQRQEALAGICDKAIESLLRLNVLMNALDFHSPDFRGAWSSPETLRTLVEHQFDALDNSRFEPELGGDYFLHEFIQRWLNPEDLRPEHLVFLSDNNGQIVISLKGIETFLLRRPSLRVTLVPKNGRYGNDASCEDVAEIFEADAASRKPIFKQLRAMLQTGRFAICRDGPMLQGLDPRRLSREFCRQLQSAEVILAEGQAYAEIRGWMKPTYLLFQVKGRVAEAIHGVERQRKALAFVRVGSGVEHFSHLNRLPERVIKTDKSPYGFHAYGQTTKDYVRAIASPSYAVLRDGLFFGREAMLVTKLREESARTGKTVAEIVLGTPIPTREQVEKVRNANPPDVFVMGGGGGMNSVTLKALETLHLKVVAGVPSADDGGSTGKLQKMIEPVYGYFFGVGDAAAVLEQEVQTLAKKPILSFRPKEDSKSLVATLISHVRNESRDPTIPNHNIADCPDYLAFVCEQLNLARIIDEHFLGRSELPGFTFKGSSIRNLNILAAFRLCGAISPELRRRNSNETTDGVNAEQAWYLLEKALGLDPSASNHIRTLPVSYERGVIWAKYSDPIPADEIRRLKIPLQALANGNRLVFGQSYIDQIVHPGKVVDFGLVGSINNKDARLPRPNPAHVQALRSARLVVMGAGSLFSSQLAQLAVPGIVDELLKKKDARRVLVLNHVCMNETSGYTLTDHIKAIENLAEKLSAPEARRAAHIRWALRIGDLFTDVVVPRTVAREIDEAIERELGSHRETGAAAQSNETSNDPQFVTLDGGRASAEEGVYRNRYVDYVLRHPHFRKAHQITDWELRILGFLVQPPALYRDRSEAGRYRGPVYATKADFKYLQKQGIAKRNIYEVESIAMNEKILKAEGKPRIERFPGLIPESLVGIFKILIQKGVSLQ